MAVRSGAFDGPFSLHSRTEDAPETNPEELIGAAHAGCFTMSLSNLLTEAGHPPEHLETDAAVTLEGGEGGGFSITTIALRTRGRVPGIDEEAFRRLAERAKETCPVSRALAGTQIAVDAQLTQP